MIIINKLKNVESENNKNLMIISQLKLDNEKMNNKSNNFLKDKEQLLTKIKNLSEENEKLSKKNKELSLENIQLKKEFNNAIYSSN